MVKRPPAGTIPDSPGSYQFKDAQGRVIYVGKASSLRQRLSNYFSDPRYLHPRTAQMVAAADSVEWTTVRNEVEALMLEYSLIKEHDPRFNVRLRDDKSYPFLAVTVDEQWPRALVMRGRKRKGTRYFGPYAHAYAIRDTLDELLRSFPIRTCSPAKFRQHERLGRPCLLYHIEKCSGPCVGEIEEMAYRQLVVELCDFLDGDTEPILKRLDAEMRAAASALEFEKAARLRDRLLTVRRAIERQQMVADAPRGPRRHRTGRGRAGGLRAGVLRAARAGSSGARASCSTRSRTSTPGGLIDRILEHLYGEDPAAGCAEAGARAGRAGRPPDVRGVAVPAARLAGADPGARSGATSGRCWRRSHGTPRRSSPATACAGPATTTPASRALTELQEHLGLPEAPLRIECYDMAHLQGTDYVGSMVVLEDGLPNKREYRRFKVHVPGNDDYAAMEEVLTRRLTAYLADQERPSPSGAPGKFAYPPQLLVVDGGKGQLGVAERVVRRARARARDPGRRAGQAVRGGLRARTVRPGRDPAGERGAVHAAADPRRGPPLRQHVPR